MGTSGTYATTVFSVAQLVEHAFRRATGGQVTALSAEQARVAQRNLSLLLATMVSKGLNLWNVWTGTIALREGQVIYTLPAGTEGVLRALRRTGTFTAAGALGSGSATLTYSTATKVYAAEFTLTSADAAFAARLESSTDGVTWSVVGTYGPEELGAGDVAVIDANTGVTDAAYWRVVQTSTPAQTPTAARFVSAASEIPAGPLSRDSYMNMPDKLAPGDPLQFWYDKQWSDGQLRLWPAPNSGDYHYALSLQRAVQDVGRLRDSLAVPTRWLEAIISELTVRTYLELPKELTNPKVSLNDMRDIASERLREAADSETDGAPVMLAPGIGVYTR